jgi:hypothetical protein
MCQNETHFSSVIGVNGQCKKKMNDRMVEKAVKNSPTLVLSIRNLTCAGGVDLWNRVADRRGKMSAICKGYIWG